MSTEKDKKRKRHKRPHATRRWVILIAILAAMILFVNVIAFSYSWFIPSDTEGKGLSMDDSTAVRSENCTFRTFQGEVVTEDMVNGNGYDRTVYANYSIDQIRYFDNYIADNATVTVPAKSGDVPGRVYFRTEIQNLDEKYPSIVSLYHRRMPANLYVAVTYPSNTFHFVGTPEELSEFGGSPYAGYPDYFIVRNAYVKVKDDNDVDGPGLLPVEWFVENRTSSDITIRVTSQSHTTGTAPNQTTVIDNVWLYLMYN